MGNTFNNRILNWITLRLLFLLLLPHVNASTASATPTASATESLLKNIPNIFFKFILEIFSMPLDFLLDLIKKLLTESISLEIFRYYWLIIVYIITIFYSLIFIYAGYNFIVSGYNVIRREKAKVFLRNILIMILLINASFYLYNLLLEINSLLTLGIIDMMDPGFFNINTTSFSNIALQFLFTGFYLMTLFTTLILFSVRSILIGLGILLFPIGIFLYFIPLFNKYGRLILNSIFIVIFIPFLSSLILLVGSLLLNLGIYKNIQILVIIASFVLLNLVIILLLLFSVIKSSSNILHSSRSNFNGLI